jgi:hypothetical protein
MDLLQLANKQQDNIVVFEFSIPAKAQSTVPGLGKIESIGLAELTASDELLAIARAKNGSAMQIAHELAKQSIATANGKAVSFADGTIDLLWQKAKPALRSMILSAYNKLNQPNEEEMDSFLNSMQMKV